MILYAVIFIPLVGLYFWYAQIIARRNKALEALSGIDVQLKNRSDLIPNILKIAKSFMEHEKQIFSEIVALREKIDLDYNRKNPAEISKHLEASEQLSQKMQSFVLKAEAYPELKSNQNMLQAQQTFNEVEAQISAARRFYNSAVASLRNSIQIFPGNLLAQITNIKDMPMFEAKEIEREPIDASKFL